ncbi:MAG: hypothetical protein HKN26_08530 [Acidimicrobiales bacterium]|nr:hypothetical protein [Acidimicrobiales bacterium]
MVTYLSPQWFEHANAALAQHRGLGAAWREHPIILQQQVEGAPTPSYALVLDGGGPRLTVGDAEDPTATFRLSHETAAAIAQGAISAQAAFQAGQLHIEGEVTTLIAGLERLAAVGDILADLRAETEF